MDLNYAFVPEYKSAEIKRKSDIVSYAGKLLEIVGCPFVIVSVDDEGNPVVFETTYRMRNSLDFECDTYWIGGFHLWDFLNAM